MKKLFTKLWRNKWKLAGATLLGLGGTILVAPARAVTWEPAAAALVKRGAEQFLGGAANVQQLRWREGGIELERFEWAAETGDDRVLLDSVRVDAVWTRLLRGDVLALDTIRAKRVDLVWTVLPSDAPDEDVDASGGAPAPPDLRSLQLPDWSLDEAHIELRGPDWELRLAELSSSHLDGALELVSADFRFASGGKTTLEGPLALRGSLQRDAWNLSEVRAGTQLSGTADLSQPSDDQIEGLVELAWEAARVELDLDWSGTALAAEFQLVPIAVEDLPGIVGLPDDWAGLIDLRGNGAWSSDEPWTSAEFDVSLGLQDGQFGGAQVPSSTVRAAAHGGTWTVNVEAPGVLADTSIPLLDIAVALEWENGLARVFDSLVEARDGTQIAIDGQVPFSLGAVQAIASAPLEFTLSGRSPDLRALLGDEYAGALDLTAKLTGTAQDPIADLSVVVENARFQDYPEGRIELHALAQDEIKFDKLDVELPGFAQVHGSAQINLPSNPSAWASTSADDAEPAWRVAPIEAALALSFPDLGKLPLRSRALRRLAGSLDATAQVDGTIAELGYAVTGTLIGGRVDFVGEIPSATDLEVQLQVTPKEVRVTEGSGAMGGGPFEFTGAYQLQEDPLECEFRLTGENLLFARSREALLRGDIDVSIAGPLEQLAVEGKLHVTSGLVATRIEFDSLLAEGRPASAEEGLSLFSLTDAPLSGMQFNVEVTSERAIGLESNVVKARIRPDLVLRGTGEVPELNGVVYIDSASLSLPASTLRISSGTVRFDPSNPFVPDLALEGGTKMMGYEVSVIVSGSMDEPEVALSSSPTMAAEDILVLILTGQMPEEIGTRGGRSDTGQSVALYFGKDLLAKWFASDDPLSDEESMLDKLEFFAGQEVSRQGTPTLEASYRLRKDYIREDDRVLLRLERDVWEDYNVGIRWVLRLR